MLTYANIHAVIFAIYGLWDSALTVQFQQTIVAYGKNFFSSLTYLLDDANIIDEAYILDIYAKSKGDGKSE